VLDGLREEPEFDRLRVETDRRDYVLGEEVQVEVTARNWDFQPHRGAIELQLVSQGRVEAVHRAEGNEEGMVRWRLPLVEPGVYTVEAAVTMEGELRQARTRFLCRGGGREADVVLSDPRLFLRLAAENEVLHVRPGSTLASVLEELPPRFQVRAGQVFGVWDTPWFVLLLCVLFALGWVGRKFNGLP